MARASGASTSIFATVPYRPDEDGELRASLGIRCPFAAPDDDRACRVCVHHRRERKTGPVYPLDVVICATHPDHYFTLYPPGHFPYGRVAVGRCSCDGQVLRDADTGEIAWDDTVMEAAQEAKTGDRWPPHGSSKATRRTQGRHLEVAGLLLGVHPTLDDDARERIATRLRIPTMTVRSGAKQWAVSWRLRGGVEVLLGPHERQFSARVMLVVGFIKNCAALRLQPNPTQDVLLVNKRIIQCNAPNPHIGLRPGRAGQLTGTRTRGFVVRLVDGVSCFLLGSSRRRRTRPRPFTIDAESLPSRDGPGHRGRGI